MVLKEFDLDATLKRKPALVLVDELAHTNAKGLRNEKRFQDIEELLKAGIDVYTTLNIQHLESLNDLVANISKIELKSVFLIVFLMRLIRLNLLILNPISF
ncbi:hypothetical protein OLQ14_00825 [Campylobacter jejuni]|nr:hypothetical protein [Campylobacter jejuni]